MPTNRLSPSRRREDIRTWWSEHLVSQVSSGQSQVDYCRARGLDQKYFTLWKRKLREQPLASGGARLVPVTLKPSAMSMPSRPILRSADELAAASAISLRLSLGSGLTVSLEIALAALPTVLRELASLRC